MFHCVALFRNFGLKTGTKLWVRWGNRLTHQSSALLFYAHDTLAETRAGFQREFPARVATKFALVSSASFQLWHLSTAL